MCNAVGPAPVALVDFEQMSIEQSKCESVIALVSSGCLNLKAFTIGNNKLLCDISTSNPRPIVPESFKKRVFIAIHSLSHPGIRTTVRLISSKFVWKKLSSDVKRWSRECLACQHAKIICHASKPIEQILVLSLPFSAVHLDIVGPFKPSNGQRYLLTVID